MEEFTLTDEQVESWRTVLITLPLPPLYLSIGAYALLAPRERIVQIVERLQEILNEEATKRKPVRLTEEEKKSTNITRTRPRKNHGHVRG